MFYLIMTLILGACAGFAGRKLKVLSHTGKAVSVTVLAMLFFLGVETGSDEQVLENFSALGLQALILALSGIAGSVVFAAVLYRILLRNRRERSRS